MHAAIFLAVVMGIPLPAPEARSKAAKLVQEVYGARIEQAKTPLQQAQLAAEIFRVAQKEKEPAPKHAAFRQAASLAVEAGDGSLGLEIAKKYVEAFDPADKRTKEQLLADADQRWDEAEQKDDTEKLAGQLGAAELWLRAKSDSEILCERWQKRLNEVEATGGRITLEASEARLVGNRFRYAEQLDAINGWVDPHEYMEWETPLKPARYTVAIEYAADRNMAPESIFSIELFSDRAVRPVSSETFSLRKTGPWVTFLAVPVSEMLIRTEGQYTLRFRVAQKVSRRADIGIVAIRCIRLSRLH